MTMDAPDLDSLPPEQRHAAHFAQMVMQLASTALVMLGRAPNPVTGKTETDLETARLLVDQLEMLEAKTKGNLGPEEQRLLQQSLMTLRMTFVEVAKAAPAAPADDAKKKFSKSYGAS